jgi:leucyl aminopeptidase
LARALAEGVVLASYRYKDTLATTTEARNVLLAWAGESLPEIDVFDAFTHGISVGVNIADSVNWAKTLIDRPAGYLPPNELAKAAIERLEKDPYISISSWAESKIEDERLGACSASVPARPNHLDSSTQPTIPSRERHCRTWPSLARA